MGASTEGIAAERSVERTIKLARGRMQGSTCFFELDPHLALSRRVVAEVLGTFLLMMVVGGSAIAGEQLSAGESVIRALISGVAISGSLLGLIFTFSAASGGHFNPLITAVQWLSRQRTGQCTLWYVGAQLFGAACGAVALNFIFDTTPTVPKAHPAGSATLLLSEMTASAGLMIIVLGCARSGRAETGPIAVAAWLLAAIVVMPSGSYANPAIALASLASAGPVAYQSRQQSSTSSAKSQAL